MKEFIYSGPINAFAFSKDGKVVFEGQLRTGQTISLPEDISHVQALVAAKLLTPVVVAEAATNNDTSDKRARRQKED